MSAPRARASSRRCESYSVPSSLPWHGAHVESYPRDQATSRVIGQIKRRRLRMSEADASSKNGYGIKMPLRSFYVMNLLLIFVLLFGPACPPRTVVIDGERVPFDTAAARTFDDARSLHEEDRHEDAIELLRDYLVRFGRAKQVPEARWLLAKSYVAIGRDADAQRALRTLVEQHPRSSWARSARIELGKRHMEAEEYHEALVVLEPLYRSAEGDKRHEVAQLLATASVGAESWDDAVHWIGEARRLATDSVARELADTTLLDLVDRQLPPAGLARLRESLPSDSPALPLVMMKIAKLHYHQREFGRAMEAADQYLARWPEGDFADDARGIRDRIGRLSEVSSRAVGVILPLSGRAQPFGEAALRGLGMALDVAASSDITLLIRDSQGDPDIAASAVEDLVLEEQAIAIIGPLLSGTSLAAATKAEELGVPLITLARADGLPQMGSWIFRNALSDAAQARALVDHATKNLGARTFGILYPNHDYGRALMNHFWNEVDARQLEVRGVERYNHDETTFQPIVRKMVGRYHLQYRPEYTQEVQRIRAEITDPVRRRRALARALDNVLPIPEFDVLFIPDSYRTVGLIAPALAVEEVITNVCDTRDIERIKETTGREELSKVQLLGPNAWHHPELVTRGGRHVRCSVFVDGFFANSKRPETRSFVELYEQIHGAGAKPDYLEAHGYDTAGIVRHIIEEVRPRDRVAFREALFGLRGYTGATGEIRFGQDGEVHKRLFLLTVDGEEIVEIEPAPPEGAPAG